VSAELDRPGELIAAGMTGYGAATVGVSFVVPLVVHRVPRVPAIVVSWVMLGLMQVVAAVVAVLWLRTRHSPARARRTGRSSDLYA